MKSAEPIFTVHCFLPRCKFMVRGADPQHNHDDMEQHYRDKHKRLIEMLVGQ